MTSKPLVNIISNDYTYDPSTGKILIHSAGPSTGVQTISNEGSGIILADLTNPDSQNPKIKSLIASTNISITDNGQDLTISAPNLLQTIASEGNGHPLLDLTNPDAQNPKIKSLVAGTGVTMVNNGQTLTISSMGTTGAINYSMSDSNTNLDVYGLTSDFSSATRLLVGQGTELFDYEDINSNSLKMDNTGIVMDTANGRNLITSSNSTNIINTVNTSNSNVDIHLRSLNADNILTDQKILIDNIPSNGTPSTCTNGTIAMTNNSMNLREENQITTGIFSQINMTSSSLNLETANSSSSSTSALQINSANINLESSNSATFSTISLSPSTLQLTNTSGNNNSMVIGPTSISFYNIPNTSFSNILYYDTATSSIGYSPSSSNINSLTLIGQPIHAFTNTSGALQYRGMNSSDGSILLSQNSTDIDLTTPNGSLINFQVADSVSGNNIYEISDINRTNSVAINHSTNTITTNAVSSNIINAPQTIISSSDFELTNIPSASTSNLLYYDTSLKKISYSTIPSSGSVNSVSITTANGISGTVSNPTTTPAITLNLGAITPTSVNNVIFTGSSTPTLAVTGTSAVSGINTGDQTITLTSDISGSGTGSFATTIGNNKVTYAKLQAASTGNVLLANPTASTGNYSEIALASNNLIGRGSAGNISPITLGSGLTMSSNVLSSTGTGGTVTNVATTTTNGITATVTNPTTTPSIAIGLGAITPTSVNSIILSGTSTPNLSVSGTATISGTNTGDQTITLTSDVTGTGTGSLVTTIGNNKVTYTKLQQASAANVVLCNPTASVANYSEVALSSNNLLGRGSAGNIAPITLGTGLTMTANVLSSSIYTNLINSGFALYGPYTSGVNSSNGLQLPSGYFNASTIGSGIKLFSVGTLTNSGIVGSCTFSTFISGSFTADTYTFPGSTFIAGGGPYTWISEIHFIQISGTSTSGNLQYAGKFILSNSVNTITTSLCQTGTLTAVTFNSINTFYTNIAPSGGISASGTFSKLLKE